MKSMVYFAQLAFKKKFVNTIKIFKTKLIKLRTN